MESKGLDHSCEGGNTTSIETLYRPQPQPQLLHSVSSIQTVDSDDSDKEDPSQANLGQSALRKQIIQIQLDAKIPQSEKAKKIQELMSRPWAAKQKLEQRKDPRIKNYLANKQTDFTSVTEDDKHLTFHSSNSLGCKHYQRACKLQAHCCGKWDTCRFCHDEVSDHTITRYVSI